MSLPSAFMEYMTYVVGSMYSVSRKQRIYPPRRSETNTIRPLGRKHGSKSFQGPSVNCVSELPSTFTLKMCQTFSGGQRWIGPTVPKPQPARSRPICSRSRRTRWSARQKTSSGE